MQFAEQMNQRGNKYYIRDTMSEKPAEPEEKSTPFALTREEAIKRVIEILKRTTCKQFVLDVLDHIASPEIKSRLLSLTVLAALERTLEEALKELQKIDDDKRRHLITYNHYVTDAIQKVQHERLSRRMRMLTPEAMVEVDQYPWASGAAYERKTYIHPDHLDDILTRTVEPDMDKFSAQQALDAHDAYYKGEKKYFIDVVTKQVIERHLVTPLSHIFSTQGLARYTEQDIHFLASEPPGTEQMRKHLECRLKMLEEGQRVFQLAIGRV
ncbi:hypothetical protein BDV59DRAFT_204470 [Aspergillus ambiguus]|uniref:uncharacterized protein n=1 Tax=Aspergillus ambiguus TaxID=176160 RepID=UPI003CCD21C7